MNLTQEQKLSLALALAAYALVAAVTAHMSLSKLMKERQEQKLADKINKVLDLREETK